MVHRVERTGNAAKLRGARQGGPAAVVPHRILRVEHINSLHAFIVWMEGGKTYLLYAKDLSEADRTAVSHAKPARNRSCFTVKQVSGNSFDVPWDVVLYHCEPAYKHFKGRRTEAPEQERAARIGQRVRSLRLSLGMSIAELARRAGMQRPNLSRLESEKHLPSLETLERIAAALGVPVVELVTVGATEKRPYAGEKASVS
ncbi:MAG: helix-turn-helix transcriptional regulator [Chloroflexi bacterium]|nr:helix-turn-helix transcriptional regulator [Chloroflexota bacterium]